MSNPTKRRDNPMCVVLYVNAGAGSGAETGEIPVMAISRKLQMVQVDVFTDRALAGNALAVCLDGRGLDTEQMQAIARETNLSETTFIVPRDAAI